MTNIYKDIITQKAWCQSHLTAKVGRNPKTMQWTKQCSRGWQNLGNKKPSGCKIIIERGGENKWKKVMKN